MSIRTAWAARPSFSLLLGRPHLTTAHSRSSLLPLVISLPFSSSSSADSSSCRSGADSSASSASSSSSSSSSWSIMRGPAPIFFTVAAAFSFRSFSTQQHVTVAESASSRTLYNNRNSDENDESSSNQQQQQQPWYYYNHADHCPFYGCPLTPQDVHYNTDAIKTALEQLRQVKRDDSSNSLEAGTAEELLSESGNRQAVTLTLIGYKGGSLEQQINQDRALVVPRFRVKNHAEKKHNNPATAATTQKQKQKLNDNNEIDDNDNTPNNSSSSVLLGVFDGHAPRGEIVAEYTKNELPRLLSNKLEALAQAAATDTDADNDDNDEIILTDQEKVKQALIETFIELDKNAPAEGSGGCTASVVLKHASQIYVANAGDSRSFLVAYRPSTTKKSTVLYITREDKPNLPDERARVEQAGGQVYIPARGTSRVVYHDPRTGAPSGLAMSRSIGDWAAGKLGVIPDPLVDVFDIDTLVESTLQNDNNKKDGDSYVVNEQGLVTRMSNDDDNDNKCSDPIDDVHIFAVSATDGMMDYLDASDIAAILAQALFDKDGAHPLTAVEHLIFAAASAWQQDKQGRYRDDIVIAVSTLRRPPGRHHRHKKEQPLAQ